jgi:polysaccharide export outer membrane protein
MIRLPAVFRFLCTAFLLVCGTAVVLGAQENPSANDEKTDYIYRLTVTDRIRVSIFQEEDLADIMRIDARGNINLKLVGDLHVAGLTVAEAQRAIEQAYRDGRFLRNPQATISIEDYAPREVAIEGQVKAPGRYLLPIESTFSIVELVTKAGGLTDIAKGTSVVITRTSPDGKRTTITVDVESLIRGKKSNNRDNSAVLLEPGDIVYVPERII